MLFYYNWYTYDNFSLWCMKIYILNLCNYSNKNNEIFLLISENRWFLKVKWFWDSYITKFIYSGLLYIRTSNLFKINKISYKEWEDRGDEEFMLFERLLLLLRNILHVPASPDDEKVVLDVFFQMDFTKCWQNLA